MLVAQRSRSRLTRRSLVALIVNSVDLAGRSKLLADFVEGGYGVR